MRPTIPSDNPRRPRLRRVIDITINIWLGVTIATQTVAFGLYLGGWVSMAGHPLLRAAISPAIIVPGMLLALGQCLRFAARGVLQPAARLWAVVFLVLAAWPIVLPLVWLHGQPGAVPALTGAPAATSANATLHREAHKSTAWLKGYDDAKARKLTSVWDCPRPDHRQAYGGCVAAAAERRAQLVAAGTAWAKLHRPTHAWECAGEPRFQLGCRSYFRKHLAKPRPQGLGHYEGMTTAECEHRVNAKYDLLNALSREDGYAARSISVDNHRFRAPELSDCANFDRIARSKWVPQAYRHLQHAVDTLKAGTAINANDQATIQSETTRMQAIPDVPYRRAYLKLAATYRNLLAHGYTPPPPPEPRMSCTAYAKAFAHMFSCVDRAQRTRYVATRGG